MVSDVGYFFKMLKIPTTPHWPTEPDIKLDSSKHDRDAMLQIIGSLITENQMIKLENQQLKDKLDYDRQRKLEEARQEPIYRKNKDALQFSRLTKSSLNGIQNDSKAAPEARVDINASLPSSRRVSDQPHDQCNVASAANPA